MTMQFGTDGIRGVANRELTPELAVALGRAAALVVSDDDVSADGGSPFLIGRDTRRSGSLIQAALGAGLASAGAEVVDVGVLPTPAVAFLSAARQVPAAMISASHNPFEDNGIKFFSPGGMKLSDEIEEHLESKLEKYLSSGHDPIGRPVGRDVGTLRSDLDSGESYERHLEQAIDGEGISGIRVVLDCANGAASVVGPEIFSRLGARVTVINAAPNGENINYQCGSTYPESMQQAVRETGSQLGLAVDGDADRVLAADENGNLVDGDQIMAMLAVDHKRRNILRDNTLVVTVMSNLGLRLAMESEGIQLHQTGVGDRNVLEALETNGWSLGGEQSGHVIFRDLATTGDGLLTGLFLCALVGGSERSLQQLASVMTRLPQVLRGVRVDGRADLNATPEIWDEVRAAEASLGGEGRVLLRSSGTEPLVRVMVEALTRERAEAVCDHLCRVVATVLAR